MSGLRDRGHKSSREFVKEVSRCVRPFGNARCLSLRACTGLKALPGWLVSAAAAAMADAPLQCPRNARQPRKGCKYRHPRAAHFFARSSRSNRSSRNSVNTRIFAGW
jgi:hypothetical protein